MAAKIWEGVTVRINLIKGPYTGDSIKLWKAEARRFGHTLVRKEVGEDTIRLTFAKRGS
jgi:hypothetical protein